jgi:hypothetical protein
MDVMHVHKETIVACVRIVADRKATRAGQRGAHQEPSHIQRIQKTLDEANIKLDSVISDLMGLSGRRMFEAVIKGIR